MDFRRRKRVCVQPTVTRSVSESVGLNDIEPPAASVK